MADTNKRRSSIWTPTFSASPNARFTFLLLTLEGDRNRECFACDLLLFLAFFALLATVSLRLRVVPAALDDFLPSITDFILFRQEKEPDRKKNEKRLA